MAWQGETWYDSSGNSFPALTWSNPVKPKKSFFNGNMGRGTIAIICCILLFISFLSSFVFNAFYDPDGYAYLYLYDRSEAGLITINNTGPVVPGWEPYPEELEGKEAILLKDLYIDVMPVNKVHSRKMWMYIQEAVVLIEGGECVRMSAPELWVYDGTDRVKVVEDLRRVIPSFKLRFTSENAESANSGISFLAKSWWSSIIDWIGTPKKVIIESGSRDLALTYLRYSRYSNLVPSFNTFLTGGLDYVRYLFNLLILVGGADDVGISSESYNGDLWGLFPDLVTQ